VRQRRRLLIIQPYIPAYRAALFRRMRSSLESLGIELALATGQPQGDSALRGDDLSASESDFQLGQRTFRIGRRTVIGRSARGALGQFRPDLVIVEQAIKNLETYPLLLRQILRDGPSIAMWGQGRNFSTQQSRWEARVKMFLTRRSDWFFAYTSEGADYVTSRGFDPRRVTVLQNTIDTAQLSASLDAVSLDDIRLFRERLRLMPDRTALFLGGVDQDKGMGFLLNAAQEMADILPGFVLLVGGAGALAEDVIAIERSGGPVRYLGRVDGERKALALRSAQVMLIPEWVGLVAVDSLVAGCPMVTTLHPSHSPEFAYLQPGANSVVAGHTASEYAAATVALLADQPRLQRLRAQAIVDGEGISLDRMLSQFTSGICQWRESI
jgi:glycosyltransferase involved in cell wall biosynthesis